VARHDFPVDREIVLGDRAEPDLVIAFAEANDDAAVISQDALDLGRE
jgi:hypothetical protein